MLQPEDVVKVRQQQNAVREVGLCGHLIDDYTKICIQARGHDDGDHERTWLVHKTTVPNPYARDSREAETVVYRVCDPRSDKLFETESREHAEWLAATLTRLDL